MNSTSTGELTPDVVTLKKFENAPRKESASTYQYSNGRNGILSPDVTAEQMKSRKEQALQDLRTYTLPSSAFMNSAVGRWHIKDYFYAGQVGVMVGLWKAGKTFSAIHISFRIAWGLPLMQPKTEAGDNAKPVGEVRLKGNVLYIPAEGAGGLKDRIKAYCQYYNQQKPEDACDVLVYPKPFDVFNEGDLLALTEYCTERKIVFIVIDTLASNLAGLIRNGHSNPENDSGAMSMMFDNITRVCVAQEHGCSGMFVHHPAKPSGGTETTNARGSGGIEASARFKLEVKADKDGGNRSLALGFNNDAPSDEAPVIPFRLVSVNVGVTEDGDPRNVAVFQCGAERKSKGNTQQGDILLAFTKVMDENREADRGEWRASVETHFPAIKITNLKAIVPRLIKDNLIELLKTKGRTPRYRLTELGRASVPEDSDNV
jgi:hypothetical protein